MTEAQLFAADARSHMDVKNVLDPSQLDAVSAYSVDQGLWHTQLCVTTCAQA